MNAPEDLLLAKIRSLSPRHLAAVEDFVDFLSASDKREAAFDRLLAIAPALESAGVQAMTEDEIATEVKASRAERRLRGQSTAHSGGNAA